MYRDKFLALLLVLLTIHQVKAQDFKTDLEQIVRAADTARSVSLAADIAVYGRKGGTKMFATTASLKRTAAASHTVLAEQEYFSDGKYFVNVDHEEQKIAVIRNDEQKNNALVKGMDIDVKSLQRLIDDEEEGKPPVVQLLSNTDGVRVYSLTHIASIKEVRITLNMHKMALTGISYEYAEDSEYKGQYIVVNYTRFDRNTDLSTSLKESNFFTLSNGKVIVNNRFKGYTLYTEL